MRVREQKQKQKKKKSESNDFYTVVAPVCKIQASRIRQTYWFHVDTNTHNTLYNRCKCKYCIYRFVDSIKLACTYIVKQNGIVAYGPRFVSVAFVLFPTAFPSVIPSHYYCSVCCPLSLSFAGKDHHTIAVDHSRTKS